MNPDISNVVLWLSAATDAQHQSYEQLAGMENLVRMLAREVYSQGGTIVHGMHPTISKWLREELESIPEDRRRGALKLVVSQFFLDSAPSPTLADEYSERIASEIEEKIMILNEITDKLDSLSNELIVNDNITTKDDVDSLIGEMDDLIKSVKDYDS